ncbi:MAG: conjugal transfer protein TraF [Rickettsiales bacterium]|jgi:conjugal transfer pilus assembly protein TraF|nr:conjugal transfer protein TraF [Rickettsiales bacterium]
MRSFLFYTLLNICFLFIINNAHSSYFKNKCDEDDLGWNFYCDPKLDEAIQSEKPKEAKQESKSLDIGEYAKMEIAEIRRRHDELLNIATIFPTEDNIKNYIKYNQFVMNKTSYVAEVAQRAIWQNPEIDYSLKRPVNAVGKRQWIDLRNQEIETTIQNINERYGLFFVYRSTCPYCHSYSPVIKAFSEKYNINVVAVSQDGGVLKEWPDSRADAGQSVKLDINTVPATILFDKETSEIIPVGFGALSEQELKQRIFNLTEIELGEDL